MEFTCIKSDLLEGINIVLKAITGKTTVPTMECIAIEMINDKIKLTTNNIELGITTLVNSNNVEDGVILVNAKIFSEIIRKLPEDEVFFESDHENNILIHCGKSKFNISGLSSTEFSFLPSIEKNNKIILSQFKLREMIRQTIFSTSDIESNRVLTGEFFEIEDNNFQITALDLYRVSIRKSVLDETYETIKVIIPGKTLNEVSKIINGNLEDKVIMYFSSNHVMFEFDNTIVVSRLIEGNYYDTKKMISSDYDTKIIINRNKFLGCMERAILLLRENDKKPVVMDIREGTSQLKMNTKLGSMDEKIDIEVEGNDMLFAFNPKFLIDVLRVIEDEDVTLYMTSSKAPCYIKNDEESYIYLILPVNLSSAE